MKILRNGNERAREPNEIVMKAPESLMKYPNEIVMKAPESLMIYPNENFKKW